MPNLLNLSRREAEALFLNGNAYIEKLIDGLKNIEIQILADNKVTRFIGVSGSAPFSIDIRNCWKKSLLLLG